MTAVADLTVLAALIFNFGHFASSEERVLGYGTKFGTVGNQERSKVIGKVIYLSYFLLYHTLLTSTRYWSSS